MRIYTVTVSYDIAPLTKEVAVVQISAWSKAEAKKTIKSRYSKLFHNVRILNCV